MNYDKLLAKSHKDGRKDATLADHARQVVMAAESLFGYDGHPLRLGKCWLRFFKLDVEMWPTFHANLVAACGLHDWGKANDGFQDAVRGKRDAQVIRHEHLSVLLIGLPELTEWLQGNPLLDVPVVLSAVMTHHLKAAYEDFAIQLCGRQSLNLLCDHNDFKQLVANVAERLNLGKLDPVELPKVWRFAGQTGAGNIHAHREQIKRDILRPLQQDCAGPNSPPTQRQRLVMAVRVALIAADAAGSGLSRVGHTIDQWIKEQYPETPRWNSTNIHRDIIEPRINQINETCKIKGKLPFEWNKFQNDCDALPSRALLLAPCGSGKTLAAWRWIAAQTETNPVSRAIFLYPTRATAKEGFRDYVSWAPEADAVLMHGTAAFDLQDMFDNEADPRHGLSYEAERRLFALGFWPKRAFSATVDQFLAFMQYSYSAICMLPILTDSVVVIDEVHSFDSNMFSALKCFLQCFDVPVLCMTATLTLDRQKQLEECGLTIYNDKPGKLGVIAELPRYRLMIADSRETAARQVAGALTHGRRVLWVVNTVARCHEVVKMFADGFDPLIKDGLLQTRDGISIYCYHSRFRLSDRIKRHEAIVESMKPMQPASLGITTQVCEMSLDLDVDLLVTEECPVTSLIQRMGRCNRDQDARPLAESGEVIVYRPDSNLPYDEEDLTGLKEFLDRVKNEELSQMKLENVLADVPYPPWGGDKLCMFLESGPYASNNEATESFRDSEDFNRECILADDVDDYLAATDEKRPGFLLPVPKRWGKSRDHETCQEHRRLPRYLGIAAADHYHSLLGYCEKTLDQWRSK